MSIKDFLEKIKPLYGLFLIVVTASIFFALGRLSALEERKNPIKITNPALETASVINSSSVAVDPVLEQGGQVIGSKNGKKYYFPWCGSLKLVKPENRVTFASTDLARAAGYSPAGNCKGLK